MFHRTAAPGTELSYNDFPAVMPHYQAVTTPTLQADIQATYDWLQKDANTAGNRVGCMGFCLGGKTSYVACATVSLQAAISFYGGGIGPGQMGPGLLDMAPKMHAPIMMFWGGLDKQHSGGANQADRGCVDGGGQGLREGEDFVCGSRLHAQRCARLQ